jgi:hypothetical protein
MIEGDAALLEPAQQVEQVRGVVVVQRGGGLVEDQQLHVLGQRLGDLDQLLLADAELADRDHRHLGQAHLVEQLLRLGVGPVPVDEPAATPLLVAEEDVLGDGEVGERAPAPGG